jgi:magnesium chelatase family protein
MGRPITADGGGARGSPPRHRTREAHERAACRTSARTALVTTRPFRAPHHTISDVGLIGGGHVPMPGEVSLAHNGVLFLDEWPEFRRHVLEVLRQPLENGVRTIARASMSVRLPAWPMALGAMNPYLCGQIGHPENTRTCPPMNVKK